MRRGNLLKSFLIWRYKHISRDNFILIVSLLIGAIGGLAAVLLQSGLHYSYRFLHQEFLLNGPNLYYLVFPFTGILMTVLAIRYLHREPMDQGITTVLYSIAEKSSLVRPRVALFFMLGSLVTVALGGSVGMEATLVIIGASAGSYLARMLHLSYQSRTLMLGCGVSAALAAFFQAPVAGVVFSLEVLMLDLTMASLIPLLLASVTGFIVGSVLTGQEAILQVTLQDPFSVTGLPYYVLLGLLCGMIALCTSRIDKAVSSLSQRFAGPMHRMLAGGVLLGLLVFLLPPLYGEGYTALQSLLDGSPQQLFDNSLFQDYVNGTETVFLLLLTALVLVKAVAVSVTLHSGGMGGFFAPSLFLGGLSGFLFARFVNLLQLPVELPEINFTLLGMAGVNSGIFHAPLTAVFLIAEITESYTLIVPLMIVCTLAYVFIMYFEPHSIFARRLAEKGQLITHHKDKAILTLLDLQRVIERDLIPVSPDDTLGQLLKNAVARSSRNIFPVVDEQSRQLLGVVLLDDIRSVMFDTDSYDRITVRELMETPPAYIYEGEAMESVVRKFDQTGAWNLPVVDREGIYVGFVSKSRLLTAYRRLLVRFSED